MKKEIKRVMEMLDEVEDDIQILSNKIKEAKRILPEITTEDEAKEWNNNFDFEEGLKHIRLF